MKIPSSCKVLAFLLLFLVPAGLMAKEWSYQKISESPSAGIYHDFITEEEALHLIELGKDKLQRSTVIANEGESVMHEGRTSSSAFLEKGQDAVVQSIEAKVAAILSCSTKDIEALQIVHYAYGQKYEPHHDYFEADYLAKNNYKQRQHTFLIYLNSLSPEAGGYTLFPCLQLAVLPVMGTALYFQDIAEDGKEDPRTLHGGMPILLEGTEKWACNIWVRQPEEPAGM